MYVYEGFSGEFAVYGSKAIPTYGYFFDGSNRVKIYRPKAKLRFMYAGHFPKPYIFGYEQLPAKGDVVFITGGEKRRNVPCFSWFFCPYFQ